MEKQRNMEKNFLTAKCSNCGQLMEKGWKYCPYCMNEKKIEKCFFCGSEVNPGWNYCPYCKKDLESIRNNNRKFQDNNDWIKSMLDQK